MSKLTFVDWSGKKLIWVLDLFIAILNTAINWASKCASETEESYSDYDNVRDRLVHLRDEVKDARQQLGYISKTTKQ